MFKNLLVVTEKWCDASPAVGLSNTMHNVFGSLEVAGEYNVTPLHYDELYNQGKTIDSEILKIVNSSDKPDLMMVLPMYGMPFNPKQETLHEVNYKKNIPVVYIWPDSISQWAQAQMIYNKNYINQNVIWDSIEIVGKHGVPTIFGLTPQDPRIFFPSKEEDKIYDVSFIGSLRQPGRMERIEFLRSNGVNVNTFGGQRESKLSPMEYADYIRKSKICLNIIDSPLGISQVKGRMFETMLCGSMCLSQYGASMHSIIPLGTHVYFSTNNELLNLAKTYLKRDTERQIVSNQGRDWASKVLDPRTYWRNIFNEKHFGTTPGYTPS